MVVLDTDHVSLLEWINNPNRERLVRRLEKLPLNEIATTIVSYEEQTRGWLAHLARARKLSEQVKAYGRLRKHLEAYLSITVLDFDEHAAVRFQNLRQTRLRIGTLDLRIAAIALAQDATLLSGNLADFRKVPGLRVEDWTA
jgi:tRNA(fMet)-specific endonuclease VapC